MKLTAVLVTTSLFAATLAVSQETQLVATHENLKVLEPLIGTWIVEDQAMEDWEAPAIKKGDTLVRRAVYQWVANENGILLQVVGERKNGEKLYDLRSDLIGWDASSQSIISFRIGPFGGHSVTKWTKDGDSWLLKSSGKSPRGEEMSKVTRLTIGENTIKTQIVETDGKPETAEPDILTRVR